MFNRQTLSNDQTALLLEQLAVATEADAPLDRVLAALAKAVDRGPARELLTTASAEIGRAHSEEQVLDCLASVLPARMKPALELGFRNGRLPVVLHTLAEQQISEATLRRRVRRLVSYPVVILGMLLALVLFLSLAVIPNFKQIFDEFDLELPLATKALLVLSGAAPLIIASGVVLLLLLWLSAKWGPTAGLVHWLRTSVPLAGRAWVWAAHEQFCAQLAALVQIGAPLDEALAVTAQGLSDRHLGRQAERLAERCRSGELLGESMARSRHFERSLSAVVNAGEKQGALAESLRDATTDYRLQLEYYASFLSKVLPPALTIFVAVSLLGLISVLFVPLLTLIENLS